MHVTALNSIHLRDINNFTHEISWEEHERYCIIRSRGVAFVNTVITCIVLELGGEGISASISKVACRFFGSLL